MISDNSANWKWLDACCITVINDDIDLYIYTYDFVIKVYTRFKRKQKLV